MTSRGLEHVGKLFQQRKIRSVAFLTGAGVSVSSGIPDFRSPGGMYDTLRPELLTATAAERRAMQMDPTTVVSWDLFRRNQLPYLELRRPFMLGVLGSSHAFAPTYRPTLAHFFMRVCEDQGLLRRVWTQNIDGLDFKTGVRALSPPSFHVSHCAPENPHAHLPRFPMRRSSAYMAHSAA